MNPLRVRARNYRTFGEIDLELPSGCAAIVGPNGAGKSSLVNLVDVCLFGAEGRSWAPYLTQGGESTELEVELTFEHAGRIYRVRRGYSARGAGKTTLDLERIAEDGNAAGACEWDEFTWETATHESQAATQAHLERILGITRETFRASSFLAQGDGAAFTEAKPADRKRVLAAVLGLDRFDRLLELVKTDRKAAQAQVDRLTGGLDRADQELAGRPNVEAALSIARTVVADVGEKITAANVELEQAAREAAELEQRRVARAEAEAQVAQAEAALRPLQERAQRAAQAKVDLAAVEQTIAALPTADAAAAVEAEIVGLEAVTRAYDDAVAERDQVKRDVASRMAQRDAILAQARAKAAETAKLDEQIRHVEGGELGSCPTCEQLLGTDAKAAAIANLRARAEASCDEGIALSEQAAGVEVPAVPPVPEPPLEAQQLAADARRRLEDVRAGLLERERLTVRVQVLRESVAAAPPETEVAAAITHAQAATSTLNQIQPAPAGELDTVRARVLAAKARVEQEQKRLDAARADETRAQAALERLDKLAQDTAGDREQRETIRRQVDRLAILERAYGRDGIPALIVQGAAVPSIETEAGRILEELGTSYRVELRTAKALKDGGMADALDIVIVTPEGERPFETFSGGERTRINLALRIGLARLLATRRGAESRILAIDEPEFLDEAGTAALARVLQGMNGAFDKSYLISHVPDLRGAFDRTIEVMKGDDGLSRIAT